MHWKLYLNAAAFAVIFMPRCQAGGHVAITLRKYQNRSHRKINGRCCDYKLFGCSPCDAYFKLCVTDSSSRPETCHPGNGVTEVVGKRDHHENINIKKEFRFTSFSGSIKLYVEVWDKDLFTRDDFVEATHQTLHAVKPGKNSNSAFKKSVLLLGSRISVALDLEVYCDPNYYGNSCSVWCQSRNDFNGHYICDQQGRKVCRLGWYGSSCNRQCVPQDDSVNGHFFCDKQGNRRCLQNWQSPDCKSCEKSWFGSKCAIQCVPQNSDTHGHYRCRPTDGKKECFPGWFGTECRVYCVSEDGDWGHYSCAHDGSKQCMNGWHGHNCTTFCIPYEDEKQGRFACDNEGNQICEQGYQLPECKQCLWGNYGANCSLPCVPGDAVKQQQGHYDCTDSGVKKCKQWWYGPECTQYCVPHDDYKHGHFTCDERDGSKVCREGWEGTFCLQQKQD